MTPIQPHKADSGAARTSPGRSRTMKQERHRMTPALCPGDIPDKRRPGSRVSRRGGRPSEAAVRCATPRARRRPPPPPPLPPHRPHWRPELQARSPAAMAGGPRHRRVGDRPFGGAGAAPGRKGPRKVRAPPPGRLGSRACRV